MAVEPEVPSAVALVRDFVNTREPQVGEEALDSASALRDWLAGRALLPADAPLVPSDLRDALAVREGLRAVLLAHAGHAGDAAAVEALNRVLAQRPARPVFGDDGGYRLVGVDERSFDAALAGLVDAVRRASEDGTWPRLKVCARDTCRWAFYDASRNSARRWCSMAGCGNHTKMQRAYAARRAHAAGAPA